MAKKKRTAKQRAATRKMIAANKARLRKKRKTARRKTKRRKTTKRKTRRNPQRARPGLAKTHLWVVFKCKGSYLTYFTVRGTQSNWTGDKGKAVLFRTKGAAHALAQKLAKKRGLATWHIGSTKSDTSATAIKNYCKSLQELTPKK